MNSILQPAPAAFGATNRWLRTRLLAHMERLRGGSLHLRDGLGEHVLGGGEEGAPRVSVHVRDPAFYRAVAAYGSVGAGEAYIDGLWDCDDLVALVRLLVRNRDLLDGMDSGLARLGGLALRAWHALRRNSRAGARRNIAAHYDLGNDFFRLFLSPDLMYSSAFFEGDGDTLEAASTRKLDRICRKLRLQPGDEVVEIGTGWGGFALHAAGRYGCRVTTTTISRQQYELARARVRDAGLEDRITVLLQDYRDLSGRFGKLVSIEMVEAIGAAQMDAYFRKIGELLAPDGLALVQAITIEDHRYRAHAAGVAATVPRQPGAGASPGLRPAFRSPVGVLSRLLRRRFPRALDRRGATADGQAGQLRCGRPGLHRPLGGLS